MSDKLNDGKAAELGSAVSKMAKKHSSRRGFLKKALIATVAVAATGKVAKKTASLITESDHQKEYLGDVIPGDREMARREYVLMSDAEKRELVQRLQKDYSGRS